MSYIQKLSSWGVGVRHFQLLLFVFASFLFYGQRISLFVAIIAMTDKNETNPNIPTYPEWDNTDTILSSFFWGYISTQTIAGQLGEHYGPKWFLVATMIIGSVFNLLIPIMAAALGAAGVMICRVVQGLSQGFLYPSLQILVSRWTPFVERTRALTIIYSGGYLGIAASMLFSGAVSESSLGWPYAFYIISGVSIIFTIIFGIFIANSPAGHRSISEEERAYIESSSSTNNDQKKVKTPWKSILRSLPVWTIFISLCGDTWSSFTLLTEIPSFLVNVMDFDLNGSSVMSALPYIVMCVMNFVVSPISDKLIASGILSVGATRKIFNTLATIGPGVALLALSFFDSSRRNTAVVLLIVALGISSFINSGSTVNVIDLSPNHAGTLLGLTSGTSQIFSILAPLTVGFLGEDKKDLNLWKKVFWIAAGINMICGVFFAVFSSGELQRWNENSECDEEEKTTDLKSEKTESVNK